jgi:hypothetical protein
VKHSHSRFIFGRHLVQIPPGLLGSWGSSVGIVTRLWAKQSGVRSPTEAGNFSLYYCIQNRSGAHPASKPMGTGGKVAMAWHLHLALRLKMHGAVLLLPQYVFMAWCLVKHRVNFTFTLPGLPSILRCLLSRIVPWNNHDCLLPNFFIPPFMITFPSHSIIHNPCSWNSIIKWPNNQTFLMMEKWLSVHSSKELQDIVSNW